MGQTGRASGTFPRVFCRALRRAAAWALAAPVVLVCGGAAFADEALEIDPVVVTAGRGPLDFAPEADVVVISREELARIPAASVEEAIAGIAGVDVRQRGPRGVQADVSVRGGTFEQTLVLIDGVKVNDPQTGHHAFDLPVALEDVERVEVLRGAAARAWGPNAFAGVVNIVTRRPAGRSVGARALAGGFGTVEGGASFTADGGGAAVRADASGSRSDGYRPNTDHRIGTVSLAATVPVGRRGLDLLAGHTEKEFGANGFYSASFPRQREDTATTFVSLGEDFIGDGVLVAPRLSWRRHRDHYVLDAEHPEAYENRHLTDVLGAEVRASLDSAAGLTTFGLEWASEAIESSSLGDHQRRRGGAWGNHRFALGSRASAAVGAFAAQHSDWGWKLWPGADATFAPGGGVQLRVAVDKAYRVPTYTELFYVSPASVGNPALRPEEAWTYEAGASWAAGAHRLTAGVFRRDGEHLIDWVRAGDAEPWLAQNVARVRTDGVELGWEWRATGAAVTVLRRLRAGYAYLESDEDTRGLASKYVLDHLRHQAVLSLEHRLALGMTLEWRAAWERRLAGEEYLLVDARLRKEFSRGEVFVDVTNLFDADYALIPGVPQPGRWVGAGVRLLIGPW